jgi:hypothetical protein
MARTRSQLMAARTVLITGDTGGIGKASALAPAPKLLLCGETAKAAVPKAPWPPPAACRPQAAVTRRSRSAGWIGPLPRKRISAIRGGRSFFYLGVVVGQDAGDVGARLCVWATSTVIAACSGLAGRPRRVREDQTAGLSPERIRSGPEESVIGIRDPPLRRRACSQSALSRTSNSHRQPSSRAETGTSAAMSSADRRLPTVRRECAMYYDI